MFRMFSILSTPSIPSTSSTLSTNPGMNDDSACHAHDLILEKTVSAAWGEKWVPKKKTAIILFTYHEGYDIL